MVKSIIIHALYLLPALFCWAQKASTIASDHIRIDHSGPIDKPIIPIVITKQPLELPITELAILVDEKVFSLIADFVATSNDVAIEKEVNEFGIFKITKRINNKDDVVFTTSRVGTIHFLKGLKQKLSNQKSAKRLIEEIDYILSRIDWPEKKIRTFKPEYYSVNE
jgi:hypothetical protein